MILQSEQHLEPLAMDHGYEEDLSPPSKTLKMAPNIGGNRQPTSTSTFNVFTSISITTMLGRINQFNEQQIKHEAQLEHIMEDDEDDEELDSIVFDAPSKYLK